MTGSASRPTAGFKYLNPFLSTSRRALRRADPRQARASSQLIVDTAALSGALAERSPDLEQLVANADRMFGAIASQNADLRHGGRRSCPASCATSTPPRSTCGPTLDDLDPLVAASKPVAAELPPVHRSAARLRHRRGADGPPPRRVVAPPGRRQRPDRADPAAAARWPRSRSGPVRPQRQASRRGALPASSRRRSHAASRARLLPPLLTAGGCQRLVRRLRPLRASSTPTAASAASRTTFNFFTVAGGDPELFGPPLHPRRGRAPTASTPTTCKRCPGANERDPRRRLDPVHRQRHASTATPPRCRPGP